MKAQAQAPNALLTWLLETTDPVQLAQTRNRMMVGAKIEQAMRQRGLTQRALAQALHKSPTVVSEWLSGNRNFTIDTLTEIEHHLGVRLIDTSYMELCVKSGETLSAKTRPQATAFGRSSTWAAAGHTGSVGYVASSPAS